MYRLLAPGGHFCVVSYEPPAGRGWLLGGEYLVPRGGREGSQEPGSHPAGSPKGSPPAVGDAAGGRADTAQSCLPTIGTHLDLDLDQAARQWIVITCGFEHEETGNYIYVLQKRPLLKVLRM